MRAFHDHSISEANYHYTNIMAVYQARNDDDSYISSLPSPPYSEDGIDQDEELIIRSDDHFDNILLQSNLKNKSISHTKSKAISKSKISHPDKIHYKNFIPSFKKKYDKEKGKKTEFVSPSKFQYRPKQIFPNLMNGSKSDTEAQVSGSKTKPNSVNKKVRCYVCNKKVENINFKSHLFFGTIECCACGWKEDNCQSFRNHFQARKKSNGCHHEELKWLGDPVNFITTCIIKKERQTFINTKMLNEHLTSYLSFIVDLWDIKPWESAIDLCRIYLCSSPSKNEHLTSVMPEANKAKKGTYLLELPEDGRYYICKEVIEECRECYSKLNIQDFKFYISTALITTKCINCNLPIYFVLTPPNNAKPFLEITLS